MATQKYEKYEVDILKQNKFNGTAGFEKCKQLLK